MEIKIKVNYGLKEFAKKVEGMQLILNEDNKLYIERDDNGNIIEIGFTYKGMEIYTLIKGWDANGNIINDFMVLYED